VYHSEYYQNYIFKMDKHIGIFLIKDGPDSDNDLEFVLVVGRLHHF